MKLRALTTYIVAIVALSFPLITNAKFISDKWVDEMNQTSIYSSETRAVSGTSTKLGFECRIKDESETGIFKIMFYSEEHLATPNSKVDVEIKIDKNKSYKLVGRTYNNSYKAGVIYNFPEELINELKAGSIAFMVISKYGSVDSKSKYSLSGSTSAIATLTKRCGLSIGDSPDLIRKKAAINNKYKKLISDLKVKRDAELAGLK